MEGLSICEPIPVASLLIFTWVAAWKIEAPTPIAVSTTLVSKVFALPTASPDEMPDFPHVADDELVMTLNTPVCLQRTLQRILQEHFRMSEQRDPEEAPRAMLQATLRALPRVLMNEPTGGDDGGDGGNGCGEGRGVLGE